jgi:TrmH family RNA methyltransferase
MTETITSKSNERLKDLRRLHERKHRERTGLFIAEGEDMLAAALAHGRLPEAVYFEPGYDMPEMPAGVEQVPVARDALASAGSLASGSRVLGVWREHWAHIGAPSLYLHDVSDPGNVGTILRAAQAFGSGPVALSPETADPFGPKAVRASMGAIFGQDVVRVGWSDIPRAGTTIALVPGAGTALRDLTWAGPPLFALGAERAGLPADIVAACDEVAHVPLAGAADSLNVAMTATLCLYEYRARTDA